MSDVTVSVAWLRKQRACVDQLAIVEREIGDATVPLTRARLMRAAELRLDLDWLAERLLPAPALAEYWRARAPALAEYKRARATAMAECAHATALAEYKRAHAPALAAALGLVEAIK